MSTLFALFEDRSSAEQAQRSLGKAEVIYPMAKAGSEGMSEARAGQAPLESLKLVEGLTLEDDLRQKGLPEEDARMFADSLRSGAYVLWVRGADASLSSLAEQLREAGAGHVAVGQGG